MEKLRKNLFLTLLLAFLLAMPAAATAFDLGPLSVGGAIRANYVIGDYGDGTSPSQPSRSDNDGGNFELDTFRINLDYAQGPWIGKAEYRFYDGYHFLHTGWVGYNFDEISQIQVGVNRVPFGPGPYGVSQSWMFDQHYYVGLSDDMDLGAKYTTSFGDLKMDFAYYAMDEGSYFGKTENAARYSYDAVEDENEDGYKEELQFNIRAIYPIQMGEIKTDIGASLEYGLLGASGGDRDDGDHWAGSIHAVNKFSNWTLAAQLTYYEYDVEDATGQSMDLVNFGAYDYYTPVAAEAMVPAISLSYYLETPKIDFIDYIIPYIEYSSIIKEESDFNDSEMWVLGAAWARGGWYIYTDLAYSNGNDFVGNESGWSRFGENLDDEWEYRFNINFGYYF
jgi:hypothetical protein